MSTVLGFDVGATKIAWGHFDETGKRLDNGKYPTPDSIEEFLIFISEKIEKYKPRAVGLGVPGTISPDHERIIYCSNIPYLNQLALVEKLQEENDLPVVIDN